uniref:Golgi associated RAB2 interactor family member 4 n=1 Tax=Jaculus jaculus TaxID=51337 RepID=A0A8C5KW80_JACJA
MTMKSEFLLPYYTAKNGSGMSMFNTAMGKLQRQLYKGEYDIFKYAPIFESDFIQITKRGEVIDVHNRVRMVTVGVACTSPVLPLPDVMLLAHPAPGCEELTRRGQATKGKSHKAAKTLELTRLLPLKFVRISVHNHGQQQLRLKFATGRSCYLQLCPPAEAREDLFAYWERLIYLLRPPVESTSSTYAIPAEDTMCMPVLDEDRMSLALTDPQGREDSDQVSVKSFHLDADVNRVGSAAFTGGEEIPHGTHKSTASVSVPITKSAELAKNVAAGTTVEATATGGVAGALSVTVTKSADSGEVSAAIAGAAATGAAGGRGRVAIAGTGKMSPQGTNITLAGAASKSKEYVSHTATSLSSEDNTKAAIARVGPLSKSAGETAPFPAPLMSALPSASFLGGEAEQQTRSRGSSRAHKDKRERREKDRAVGRSSHHARAGEGHRKRGREKMGRKSPSRRDTGNVKNKGSPRDSAGHIPIAKEPWSAYKWGRSFANASSSSTSKRLGRISSFLRNIRANLVAKGLASQRIRDMDIMAKTVETTNMEAIVETAESGQGLEIVGSVTSEVMETMTFDA